jgi:hypothetical protein
MGVALLKKDDGSDDPRSALREAIAARTVTHAKAELQRKAVERAHTMVRDAEARLTVVGEALEATRSGHAEALAQAASTGAAPTANGALRAARLALSDAEDEADAVRAAFEQLKADRGDDQVAQAENAVLTEVARVLALTGRELLARAQRAKAELLILTETLYALTSEETVGVPLFGGEIARLNGQDQRRAPLLGLRDEVLKLSSEPRSEELAVAREAVEPWVRWRSTLRRDADAPDPSAELPT